MLKTYPCENLPLPQTPQSKKLSDAQKQFIAGDDINNERTTHGFEATSNPLSSSSQQANAEAIAEISNHIGSNLKQELFGDRRSKESSIRFTVDIPESLNKRLAQLSVDTGKPKTELVRTILDRALNSLDY